MKWNSLIAVSLVLAGSVACASAPDTTPGSTPGRDTIQVGEGSRAPEESGTTVSPQVYPSCTASQLAVADDHCAEHHAPDIVWDCHYNAATGYVVYTYGPRQTCPLCWWQY